jgi:hypothetical protein
LSGKVRLFSSNCVSSIWKSDSHVLCKAPFGFGGIGQLISFSFGGQSGPFVMTFSSSWEYDIPQISMNNFPQLLDGSFMAIFPNIQPAIFSSNSEFTQTSVVLTVGGSPLNANQQHTLTLSGVTMGPPFSPTNGITVSANGDTSTPVSTGSIGSQVGSVILTIQPSERIAGSTNRRITISFITVTSLPTGGSITINYPSGFFKSGVIPFVVGANTNIVDTSSFSETSIFLYVCAPVVAGTIVVTLGGVTLGPVTSGSLGISVSTSMDYVSSGVSTGSITASSQITGVILTINSVDRVAGASSKTITLTFKTSTRHPSGSKITLVYPPAFFGSGISPTSNVS